MKNKEILEKALEKAVKNGFQLENGYWAIDPACMVVYPDTNQASELYTIIFSHDFAKAFWGEAKHDAEIFDGNGHTDCTSCQGTAFYEDTTDFCWQYHLQQMVISEDPIKYLEKYI